MWPVKMVNKLCGNLVSPASPNTLSTAFEESASSLFLKFAASSIQNHLASRMDEEEEKRNLELPVGEYS